jgi:glutamate-1-semialdehyde 2,1-aminomutase
MQEHQKWSTSRKLFAEASKVIPGGVNSPVRAFKSVGGDPLFIAKASGSKLWDVDGNEYIDYVGSWGPAILGHAHPEVLKAVAQAAENGLSFGAPTEQETDLAKYIQLALPSMELIRFVSSGTEACMAALRVARGFTRRSKILKFEGCYHGHGDMLLVKAGSGAATLGTPDSLGVTQGVANDTLTVPFNDLGGTAALFEMNEIAAVIVEPIVGNSGFIRPREGFLEGLRELCTKHGALLIFDEVMTGFRVAWGGAQALWNITPDLTTLGKVIGGGMPLAAYGGRRDVMSMVAPVGPVYQAGTLSGNPVAVACGLATLKILKSGDSFKKLSSTSRSLTEGLTKIASNYNLNFTADCEGGMFGFFFNADKVYNFSDAKKSDVERFRKFFWGMLDQGVYLAPSAFEAGFVSTAHTEHDITLTLERAESVMKGLS